MSFGYHNWCVGGEVLLVSSGERPERLLRLTVPTRKNDPASNADSAEVKQLSPKGSLGLKRLVGTRKQ
jgi:hypothetical protein